MHVILKIYDWMEGHRRWCLASLLCVTLVLLALVLRLDFREDISDFLPLDSERQEQLRLYQEVSGAGRIIAVFETGDSTQADPDVLTTAIDQFVETLEARDTARLVSHIVAQADLSTVEQTMQFVYDNIPYFLEAQDYRRMDSLLATENYISRQLQADREMLMLPEGGLLSTTVERDPLNLFSPVTATMRQAPSVDYEIYEGYIFLPDMRRAIVMLDSSFGNSETKGNARVMDLLQECASHATVKFIGGPVVAVGNAQQIKTDSILSITIAAILILALLYYTFRRIRNLLLIVIAIAWGWLFALGCLSLVHREVSIIVVGISSVILGIAVNYPLHLISHLRHTPDIRQTLCEISKPLVVGNVTTVGAFLALVPLQSVALRDLGLFSAFLLVGTILFVLLWMPHFLPCTMHHATCSTHSPQSTIHSPLYPIHYSLIPLILLTLYLGYHSREVEFDTDLNHINYMTEEQKAGMALLGESRDDSGQSDTRFLLSDSIQEQRLAQWQSWTAAHREQLLAQLEAEAPRAGFAKGSFDAFGNILAADYEMQSLTYFRQLPPSLLLQNIDVKGLNRAMLTNLTDNFNYIGWACGLIVFLFLWCSFRSLFLAVLSFLPMAISWVWILGIMSLFDIHFNIVNIILATFIFGQGDDYTIFMTEGAVYETLHRRPVLASYRKAILLSALIMFIGIGSLIVARHPALHSLAQVTIVGMSSVVLMALVLPPTLFRWYVRYRRHFWVKSKGLRVKN